jgi:peptide/nickel transport system substrate-binding protein
MISRKFSLSFVFVCLALLLACSSPDKTAENDTAAPAGPPVQGDTIIVRYDSEPESLNPIISSSANAVYAVFGSNYSQIMETMLGYDEKDWSVTKPILAESYPEISDDRLVYTFTVRDGVKWHDGKPFTAEDVLFSAKATAMPLTDAAASRTRITDLDDVQVIDGRKVRFTMRKPYYLNDVQLGNSSIFPKHIFDAEGLLDGFSFKDVTGAKGKSDPKIKKFADQFNKHPNNRAPIGTGPYKFEKWETGKEIVLTRNEDYWGTKPYLDRIVLRIITDNPAALTALKAGEVDLLRLIPIQYSQQTSGPGFDDQFVKQRYSIPQYQYLGWNLERPYFKDKRVRQALAMLIDRQQIIDSLFSGLATLAASPINPSSADYNPNIKPLPYDPKRAMELLDEAGWKDHDGDGIRDKDGVPFKFEILGAAGSTLTGQLVPIFKEQFRKAGIEMNERLLDFTVFIENLRDHKFDAGLSAWTSDLVTDPYQLFHSSSSEKRGSNHGSFRNAEADKMLEQARTEFDPQKRKQLYWRFQEIVADEQPYMFLSYRQEAAAHHKRFQNAKFVPSRPGYDLNVWFVPKSMQKYTGQNTP